VLMTANNMPVLSDSGPITVPSYTSINIGNDGTISIVPAGQSPSTQVTVGRLKVVQAQPSDLQRGVDGLMHAGVALGATSGNCVTSGALESSNVNLTDAMVNMIQLARQFELQTKLMQAADQNASASTSLVRMNS